MDIGLAAIWILVGWCGTPPRPWPRPWPPGPTPDPWIIKVIGVVGGLIGGFMVGENFGIVVTEGMGAINVLTTGLGAFVGSYFLGDMYNLARGLKQK